MILALVLLGASVFNTLKLLKLNLYDFSIRLRHDQMEITKRCEHVVSPLLVIMESVLVPCITRGGGGGGCSD